MRRVLSEYGVYTGPKIVYDSLQQSIDSMIELMPRMKEVTWIKGTYLDRPTPIAPIEITGSTGLSIDDQIANMKKTLH